MFHVLFMSHAYLARGGSLVPAGTHVVFPVKLQDLSVVLTGATSSVGAALARALIAGGARVLLVARSAAPLAELARELTRDDDHRHRVDALASDVTNPGALLGIRDAAVARGANVLINTAYADDGEALQALDAAHIDAILQNNLVAPVQLTRALLPHLLRQPSARVLNLGLPLGLSAHAGGAVHRASQLGLRGFCDALRRELAGTRVRVQFLATRTSDANAPANAAQAALRLLVSGTGEPRFGMSGELFARLAQRLR